MTLNLSNFINLLCGIYEGKSLCRILQNIECKKIKIRGRVMEFGAEPKSKKNFSSIAKQEKISKVDFSVKYIRKKGVINAHFNFVKKIKKNHYHTVMLFNVLEHLNNIDNAKNEIWKILKKKGLLIGSTPFLFKYHNAPSDYLRFTKSFFEVYFKKKFHKVKIKNLGFGPFCLSYSMICDYTKKIPFLNPILFSITFFLDFFLSKLVKYNLEDIYPIAVFFVVKKK